MITYGLRDREKDDVYLIHVCENHRQYVNSMMTDNRDFDVVYREDLGSQKRFFPFIECDICLGIKSGKLDDYPK